MSRRAWLFAAAILLVLVSVTLAIPSVRSRLFGLNTMSSPPEGVPSLAEGNFLAVLPIEVQGEVDTLGDIAQGLNEEVSRKLSLLQALHVVSAAEAEDKAAKLKFDLKGPVETTARNLGANLVLQVTTALHTGGWIRLNLNLQDVADRRVVLRAHFSSNVLDGPLTLAERIFMEILKALKLTLSKEEETRAASPTSSFQAYAFYLKGRTAFKNHREQPFNVAVGFFEQAVKQDPGFALAYAELANVNRFLCRGTGDKSCWIKVLEIAQKASALNDGLPEVRWALAAVYSETGRYDEAIAEHKQVLQLARTSDEGWRRLGQTYKSARQKEQSIEAFTKAVMVNSYSIYNRNELGIAYLENGQYHDAESTFRQEIKLNPDYYAGYLNVGEVYRYQAKYDDAVNEYLEALQHHPDVEVYTGLGLAYLYLKRYNDAIKMLEKGVELNPNEETVGSLADGYHWSGENEKAQANYDRAILLAKNQLATNPKLADVLDHLGLYYAKRGNAALADQYIGRARSLDPSDPRLIYDEAIVRALANQPTRAMDSLRLAFGGDGNLARRATFEPALGSLQSRPEFKKLVANFNRPESGQAFAPTLPKVADSTR